MDYNRKILYIFMFTMVQIVWNAKQDNQKKLETFFEQNILAQKNLFGFERKTRKALEKFLDNEIKNIKNTSSRRQFIKLGYSRSSNQ